MLKWIASSLVLAACGAAAKDLPATAKPERSDEDGGVQAARSPDDAGLPADFLEQEGATRARAWLPRGWTDLTIETTSVVWAFHHELAEVT
jgi:hypothetical protein